MIFRTSAVAARCSRASVSSRASRAFSASLLSERRRLRLVLDAAPRFALIVGCVFAGLRLVARRRLT